MLRLACMMHRLLEKSYKTVHHSRRESDLHSNPIESILTLPEHLISRLVFIEVHVVLLYVSPYFM